MHTDPLNIDIDKVIESEPMKIAPGMRNFLKFAMVIGILTFTYGFVAYPPQLFWAAYYSNLVFWMGLAAGGCLIPCIFQIVRARWSPPVRRLAEANVSFLPYAYLLFLVSYFGRESLFPWARHPMPGREWWMQPNFVYARFAVLLAILFFLFWRFVRLSLRGDIGLIREKSSQRNRWHDWLHRVSTKNWLGSDREILPLQRRMSIFAPVIVIVYMVIYSLFSFEMIMGMDEIWYSNMFGGFQFVGNIYIGWAALALVTLYYMSVNRDYSATVGNQQLWDLGKLTLGFSIIWAYLFFSQFLPQWYGNLPEETQWLILRTREFPWKGWGWTTFSMCFVLPFILLLSRDLKKTPAALAAVSIVVLLGVWSERYIIIMPQVSPDAIPFGLIEIGLFLGFFGVYGLSLAAFLARVPYAPVSHPLTRGSVDW